MGDMTSPLKRIMPGYRMLEHRVHARITEAYGLPADLVMLALEKREIWRCTDEWALLQGVSMPADYGLACSAPREAERRFHAAFRYITRAVELA